jgi:hypothetical protein
MAQIRYGVSVLEISDSDPNFPWSPEVIALRNQIEAERLKAELTGLRQPEKAVILIFKFIGLVAGLVLTIIMSYKEKDPAMIIFIIPFGFLGYVIGFIIGFIIEATVEFMIKVIKIFKK